VCFVVLLCLLRLFCSVASVPGVSVVVLVVMFLISVPVLVVNSGVVLLCRL